MFPPGSHFSNMLVFLLKKATGSCVWHVGVFWCHAFPRGCKHVSSQYQTVLKLCVLFFSRVLSFFPSLSFIPLLSSQGLAHMMAEQGMPLLPFSLSCLCLFCDCNVELHVLALVWNKCESAWFYIHCDIQCHFIIVLYCPTKPKRTNYIFGQNSVEATIWLLLDKWIKIVC